MAKVRILKRQEKAYLELPPEMLKYDELELFQLKEGYYLLSMPLRARKELSESEKQVLRKLVSIRFEKRTPAYVAKVLSEQEKGMLEGLEKRGHINVFRGKKYKNGVYNISDRTYPLLKKGAEPAKKAAPQYSDHFTLLKTQGFIIIKERKEAFELSQRLKQEMKRGSAVGIKGFDGRFYIVTAAYLSKAKAAVSSALKEDMDNASIAEAARLDHDGCMAVLRVMAENGEIIEKKRGVFAPV